MEDYLIVVCCGVDDDVLLLKLKKNSLKEISDFLKSHQLEIILTCPYSCASYNRKLNTVHNIIDPFEFFDDEISLGWEPDSDKFYSLGMIEKSDKGFIKNLLSVWVKNGWGNNDAYRDFKKNFKKYIKEATLKKMIV